MMLAKAAGCEEELQRIIVERWGSIGERNSTDVVLGLSDTKDVAGWMPVISALFELNKNNDIRTQVVRVANNMARATESAEIRTLLDDLLRLMPVDETAYSNPDNHRFVNGLRHSIAN